MTRAVLFDIDGTLVLMGGAGRRALIRATIEVTGLPGEHVAGVIEAIDFRGSTDAGILDGIRRGLELDGATTSEQIIARYLSVLPETVRDAEKSLLPGVTALLDLLEAPAAGCVVGLLTGNVREGARIKLGAFGMEHLAERPGGFGDDGAVRRDVALAAVERLGATGVPAERTVVIGDTEHDVTAARAAGARTVAVATGWTDRETLEASRPDLLLSDLSDPSAVISLVDSLP